MDRERIGPYEVLETVAVERQTISYRARRSAKEPTVIVTTVKPGTTDVAGVARLLEREAERLRGLRHPALPSLLELLPDGPVSAIVVADLGGHRLDTLLERVERIEPLPAVAIALEVSRALAAVHHAGEVHGALRPSLVELTERGGVCLHGHVGGSTGSPAELIAPEHMSPEQIIGEPADARSDVFLLGVVLYRMLTGRGPFEGDEEGVSQRIRHHAPIAVHRLAPEVPAALERIVMRCLAKRAVDRFPDIASLAGRLTHLLRAQTSLPSEHLVARTLARAGLADPLPPPLDRGAERGAAAPQDWLRAMLLPIAGAVIVVLLAVLGWQALRDDASPRAGGPRGIVDRPAHLRVLARPWAEIYIDGRLVDVTPVGYPIEVSPGPHRVVLRHPNAPDELRPIEIIAGQTLLIDVDMNVTQPVAAPTPDAGAGDDAEDP